MSSHEFVLPQERKPAIDPSELILSNGQYANKKTLLEAAAADLPVPSIIPESELPELFQQWKKVSDNNPKEYQENFNLYSGYRRGLFRHPLDMWAVDMLPTVQIAGERDNLVSIDNLHKTTESANLRSYLKTNFGVEQIPVADSFVQQSLSRHFFYISTWSHGEKVFTTLVGWGEGGVDACFDHYGTPIYTSLGYSWFIIDDFQRKILPLDIKVKVALDCSLRGKFDYKNDYLTDCDKVFLIQSRVASRQTTDSDFVVQADKINDLTQQGIPIIDCEVGNLDTLPKNRPYILRLTNNMHRALYPETLMSLDMRGMQGLQLPMGLEGGLLRHHGYAVIAYALYWGLPLMFLND